jgi:hypothetical protein
MCYQMIYTITSTQNITFLSHFLQSFSSRLLFSQRPTIVYGKQGETLVLIINSRLIKISILGKALYCGGVIDLDFNNYDVDKD